MSTAPASTPTAKPLTFQELAAIAWRRRFPTAIVATAMIVVVLIATARITPMYEAEARLAVDRGSKTVPFHVDGEIGTIDFSLLNTQRELLLSGPVLERALQTSPLKDAPAYATAKNPAAVLRKRMKITTNRDSWVIAASLQDEDPARAAAGLEAVVKAYLAYQVERQSGRSHGAVTFLREQVDLARTRLDEAHAREEAFRIKNGIQSTDAERNHLALRVSEMTQARAELERELSGAATLATQVRESNALADADARRGALLRVDAIGRHPAVLELQERLYIAEADAAKVSQKYLDKHPRALEAKQRIAVERANLDQAIAAASATVEANERTIAAQVADLGKRIDGDQKGLGAYRESLIDLAAMSEERRTRQGLFESLLKRLGEEEVASNLGSQKVTLIDPATAGTAPVNIRRSLFLAFALVAGAVAGALTALLMEALDRRVRGAENASALTGLPILGAVPHAAGLTALGRGGDPEKPHQVAEALRAVRAALLLTKRRDGARCLVMTSTGAGEGKSTLSTRLAVSLASTGARVLLIDADMRKPTLHHQLGEGDERGLSFLLAGYDGIAPQSTSYANLDFIGVGVRPPNPAELLHSPALGQLIQRSRAQYQFIVIDTPPLGAVSDALIAAEHADGVLMVVRDRVTSKSALALAMRRLAPIAEKVIGLVLNDERRGAGAVGYYYNYQYTLANEPAARS
ncbi:MAG TPA: polysaccharide biosynthesis tyrosine autokinase [Planctomycetota bacterium]|nr:polysaccharide biosynthesis tyrosine autokinase [Planctomycetota bacterium]